MGPYMSRAIATIHIQENTGSRTSSTTMDLRSHRRGHSSSVGGRSAGATTDGMTALKLDPNPECGLCTAAPKGGSRSPQRLGQLAIPLLPQITELLCLVRTLRGAIPRLADIFREIVKAGVREIA